ncbi:MAG: inner membrane protein YiaA [Chloroflexota bacterium]
MNQKPTQAFVMASWAALGVGILTYMIGLWNASIALSEKGFYLTILLFGLFGAVSVQKNVRDQLEGVPVTNIYYGISWVATVLPILLLIIGLINAEMLLSEKGFYGVAFVLSLFAAVVVQKNTRDSEVTTTAI